VYPEEWDPVEHRIVFKTENSARFPVLWKVEAELEKVRQLLEERVERFVRNNREFSAADVLNVYRRRQGGSSLLRFVNRLSRDMTRLGQERTARGYETTVRRLIAFTGDENMHLRQITPLLIRRFEYSLREEGKALNTVSFYMRNLRAIYNKAIKDGKLEASAVNPFEEVYTGIEVTKKRALSIDEMTMLQNWKPLSVDSGKLTVASEKKQRDVGFNKGLQKAQQLFLFGFHARGMSFVDMAFLKKSDIREGVITYRRKKTGQLLEIKINTEMNQIIRYFKEETTNSLYVFPLIHTPGENERLQYESALRTQNNRLKRLAINCQLSTVHCQLSSHVARHTWATIAKQQQVPLVVISEGLGHTSEKTTVIYLASFDREVLDRAALKVSRAIKKTG